MKQYTVTVTIRYVGPLSNVGRVDEVNPVDIVHYRGPSFAQAMGAVMQDAASIGNDSHYTEIMSIRLDVSEAPEPETEVGHDGDPEGHKGVTHVVHYVSEEPEKSGWSVYREEYNPDDLDNPIEGRTVRISTHGSEASADAEASRLQQEAE